MVVTEQQVLEALRGVEDPETHKDIVALGQVKGLKVLEGNVSVELSTPSASKERIRQSIHAALSHLHGVEDVFVNFAPSAAGLAGGSHAPASPRPAPQPPAKPGADKRGIPGVRHIIAVGAGKGGVGKSTVSVNVAIALALSGKKVGILDGDIYGPSIPTLTGIVPRPPQIVGDRIVPFTLANPADPRMTMPVMSIGFMVDKEKALIWRGPMAHGAMKQMIEQVQWTNPEAAGKGEYEIDYLIVDLPPGTGDVSLTLAQSVPLTGAVIVATPQEVALADARRAVRMFQQLGVEILGVVENMSHFICEHGTSYDIFGRGGAQVMAQQMGLPFLGEVPIDAALRQHSDAGTPFANFGLASASRKPLMALADNLDKQVAVRMAMRPAAKAPRLDIS